MMVICHTGSNPSSVIPSEVVNVTAGVASSTAGAPRVNTGAGAAASTLGASASVEIRFPSLVNKASVQLLYICY